MLHLRNYQRCCQGFVHRFYQKKIWQGQHLQCRVDSFQTCRSGLTNPHLTTRVCCYHSYSAIALLSWRSIGLPLATVRPISTCSSIWQKKTLQNALQQADEDFTTTAKDLKVPDRFGHAASLFAHINHKLSPDFVPMSVSVSPHHQRTGCFQAVATLHWPEKTTLAGKPARNKKLAMLSAKTEAIRFLLDQGLLSASGEPILYSREQINQQMAALRTNPRVHVPEHLRVQVEHLHHKLMRIRDSIEDERGEEEAWKSAQCAGVETNNDGCSHVFGGPDTAWPEDRLRKRSYHLRAALDRCVEPANLSTEEVEEAQQQQMLPITSWRSAILSAIESHRVVIVRGETGCGKSTQVPQMILDAWSEQGRGAECNVVVTQPRRISAVSLARRIAQLRGEQLRDSVGYQVRLDTCLPRERGGVLFCTTGIILARLHDNPNLHGVSHLIVDEVHERSVQTDILLLLVRRLLRVQPQLRVVLMSASVDTRLFAEYFHHAPVIDVPGRVFPVSQHFLEDLHSTLRMRGGPVAGELQRRDGQDRPKFAAEAVARVVEAVCRTRPPGAVLVFLEGVAEINQVEEHLHYLLRDRGENTWILPVSGRLSSHQQRRIFSHPPPGVRKVVLATNVAETGITVDDVVYVVDTGAVKQARLDPERGVSCLRTEWISQSSAAQRRGRAGRVQPGESYHLYSRSRMQKMDKYETPELLRVPLETVVLNAKHLCPDVGAEEFLSAAIQPPPASAVRAALDQLRLLQMLEDGEQLTALGELAAKFELHPRQVRMLVYGAMLRCLEPTLTMVGWEMSGREPYDQAVERRPELLKLKRSYSRHSDAQVAVRLFRHFVHEMPHSQKRFCEDNMLFYSGMRAVKALIHMIRGQLISAGLAGGHNGDLMSGHTPQNEYAEDWNMVNAAHIAGHVRNVAQVKRGTIRNGRVRSKDVVVKCSEGVAMPVGDSVNRSPCGEVPFLAYGSAFFSTQRRRLVLRDVSQAHPLTVAVFYGDNTQVLAGDKDTGMQRLCLSCGGEHAIYLEAEASVAQCIRRLRSVLNFTIWHHLEALRSTANHSAASRDVTDLHHHAVRLLADILSVDQSQR